MNKGTLLGLLIILTSIKPGKGLNMWQTSLYVASKGTP